MHPCTLLCNLCILQSWLLHSCNRFSCILHSCLPHSYIQPFLLSSLLASYIPHLTLCILPISPPTLMHPTNLASYPFCILPLLRHKTLACYPYCILKILHHNPLTTLLHLPLLHRGTFLHLKILFPSTLLHPTIFASFQLARGPICHIACKFMFNGLNRKPPHPPSRILNGFQTATTYRSATLRATTYRSATLRATTDRSATLRATTDRSTTLRATTGQH